MPKAGNVAVVDLENFKVLKNVPPVKTPFALPCSPDGRYLWVETTVNRGQSGVTIIDTPKLHAGGHIPTGAGHHEIAFSDDSLHAFVTNSIDHVSVIDSQKTAESQGTSVGKNPVAVSSLLSAERHTWRLRETAASVVDGARLEID